MDQLIAAAVRQGFKVWQNEHGVWFFRRGPITVTTSHTPHTGREWMRLIGALRGAGLDFPPGK
jgi:hypothetical protein